MSSTLKTNIAAPKILKMNLQFKTKLDFEESEYKRVKNLMLSARNLLVDAKSELENIGAKYELKDLLSGNFVEMFHNYQREAKAQEKDSFVNRLSYEKYLELLDCDISKIKELEENYKSLAFREYKFYAYNHSFYTHCENNMIRNASLKEYLKDAPVIKKIKPIDLFVIKRDKIEVNLDKELFTVYATNSKQTDMIKHIKQFVDLSKKLYLTATEVKSVIGKYLFSEEHIKDFQRRTGKVGLSTDMKTINFDYDEILKII